MLISDGYVVNLYGDLRVNDAHERVSTAFCAWGVNPTTYFFRLITASFSCLPALNLTAFVAGILILSAVYGL
jgi:hypothetical protein